MKRRSGSSQASDKSIEPTTSSKQQKFITFDYNNSLDCFKAPHPHPNPSPSLTLPSKPHPKTVTEAVEVPVKEEQKTALSQLRVPRRNRGKMSNSHQAFNNKLLLLEYEGDDERPDVKSDSLERGKESPKSEDEDQAVSAILKSCMLVITEETENSSNPVSARFSSHCSTPHSAAVPMMMPMMPMVTEEYMYYMMKEPAVRNKRAVSQEESRNFIVVADRVQLDGRTTIMVRNIPNKYTQDMLLELFEKNHKKKFDFFYLPIDYNNNCNVGYAFLNFLHSKFITDFYQEFHQRKWNKFNSVKVCHVCYARIQGTAQLEHHFQHSNVLQQKEKRFRPLIGMKSLGDNITHLVQKQKDESD